MLRKTVPELDQCRNAAIWRRCSVAWLRSTRTGRQPQEANLRFTCEPDRPGYAWTGPTGSTVRYGSLTQAGRALGCHRRPRH